MDMKPWKVERTSVLFSHPRVMLTEEIVRLPDGSLVDDYLQIKMAEHVVIITRKEDGKFLLLRQYKHGPRTVSLTFPAGVIELGEESSAAARRELREETGIDPFDIRSLGRFVLNGNQGAGAVHLFLVDQIAVNFIVTQTGGDLEEQETLWLTEDELLEAVRTGQFKIATHALALCFALNPGLWPANS